MVGASVNEYHTSVWTDEGELFTVGKAADGRLGHGGQQYYGRTEHYPRKVASLAARLPPDEKKVVGASTGRNESHPTLALTLTQTLK